MWRAAWLWVPGEFLFTAVGVQSSDCLATVKSYFKPFAIAFFGVALLLWALLSEAFRERHQTAPLTNKVESDGAELDDFVPLVRTETSVVEEPSLLAASGDDLYVYDNFSTANRFLISKIRAQVSLDPESEVRGDLWLRDNNGSERLIAQEVTWAKFSPDGSKVAYVSNVSNAHELFVQTREGVPLAKVSNVSDPNWCEDSAALNFQAVLSSEYPELRQVVVYDLSSGRMTSSPATNSFKN
jgi:hypothetical protein